MSVLDRMWKSTWTWRTVHVVGAVAVIGTAAHALIHPESITKWDVVWSCAINLGWILASFYARNAIDLMMAQLARMRSVWVRTDMRMPSADALEKASAYVTGTIAVDAAAARVNTPPTRGNN